jgi:hypothetical protein
MRPCLSSIDAEARSAPARAKAPESRSWRVVPGVFGLAGASVAAPSDGCTDTRALDAARPGARVRLADLVLVRQRPGSARGIVFVTVEAVVEITGLRNPCAQLDHFQPGLMAAMLGRDEAGGLIRKSGVMAIVLQGGVLRAGDPIMVIPPAGPHRPLQPV